MKRLLFALLVALAPLAGVGAQDAGSPEDMTIAQMQVKAPELHPAILYVLASRLLANGEGQQAANWMYAGQLRYRFLLAAQGEAAGNELVLFNALTEQVGRPVNEYIAGDVDEWLAAMDWALEWDAAHPNVLTSKIDHADALAETRAGLERLRAMIEERRDEIPLEREANGLENR